MLLLNIYLRDRPLRYQLLDQLLSKIMQPLLAQERRIMNPRIVAIRKDPDIWLLRWEERT